MCIYILINYYILIQESFFQPLAFIGCTFYFEYNVLQVHTETAAWVLLYFHPCNAELK